MTAETQATILQVLAALSLVMPVLERVVKSTQNKVDDQVFDFVSKALALVPRVRGGSK